VRPLEISEPFIRSSTAASLLYHSFRAVVTSLRQLRGRSGKIVLVPSDRPKISTSRNVYMRDLLPRNWSSQGGVIRRRRMRRLDANLKPGRGGYLHFKIKGLITDRAPLESRRI